MGGEANGKAVAAFCKKRGLKIQHFVEEALVERLEDQIDVEAYENRRSEENVSLEAVLKSWK
ncbi:MAG TPA: hypothetical protein VI895_12910 [Bdellovibrionota bacterium]|nr:hypothetical protein [Bdellovibrionota bacterium]